MFKTYRQEGCLFECRLRYAQNITNCIPWDYPVPQDLGDVNICLTWQNETNKLKEFDAIMNDPDVIETCKCLPDCEEITYETQVCSTLQGDPSHLIKPPADLDLRCSAILPG